MELREQNSHDICNITLPFSRNDSTMGTEGSTIGIDGNAEFGMRSSESNPTLSSELKVYSTAEYGQAPLQM